MRKGGLILILILFLALPAWGTVYYIDSASPGGDGTSPATAFKTLSAAQSAITGSQPDSSLLLRKSCVWQETLILGMSGTIGHPFVIGSYGVGDKPVIDATGRNDGIDINEKNNITITELVIKNANHNGIVAYSGGSDIVIDGCSILNNKEAGIKAWSVSTPIDNWIIRNCEISSNLSDGIDMSGICTNWLIEKNSVHHNCSGYFPEIPEGWMAGIKLITIPVANNIIQYNDVYANGLGDFARVNGLGIWLDTVGPGNIIRYNRTCSNNWSGIMNEATNGTQIYYNISLKNNIVGIYVFRSSSYNVVYNKVCYGNSIGLGLTGDYPPQPGNTIGNIFKNNISFGNSQSQLRAYFDLGGTVYEHNCLGPNGTSLVEWDPDNFISTYSAWESEYGDSTHSVQADPQFIIPGADFHLQPSSPCIRAGIWVGLEKDYDGNLVGNPPSIGAFEKQSTPIKSSAVPTVLLLLLE